MKVSDLKKDRTRSIRMNSSVMQYCKDKKISIQKLIDQKLDEVLKDVSMVIKKVKK